MLRLLECTYMSKALPFLFLFIILAYIHCFISNKFLFGCDMSFIIKANYCTFPPKWKLSLLFCNSSVTTLYLIETGTFCIISSVSY